MKWSVQQLNTLKNKGIKFDEMVDVSDIKKVDQEIRNISLVHVKGEGTFSNHSVTFTLEIKGEMILPCSRTLADVSFPFEIETAEMFKLHDWIGFDDRDDEIHDLINDTVDLLPYIKQAILLEIPIQIFCEDKKGEAPPKGNDWELITEENKKERIDPRLADLAKFFDDK
ncbi:YceD family protein [Anaerobacillus isosaccharinicus]|uniref:DUF177 domain-containing protein n=1 Tax=Anaerobacillus isosaccharinicus TaxID=1532552 RepID=A0A1S2M742_9BACI|nr:DUF177 domain-containing protein [Anaerobacillus isosaccharinicus]MBA5587455.1 DUF177 domain-containing protein [Anaerobacillus isosaccharinicus]QOY34360.1 DUF177 domain-containing protein [Anaerobacillus isosaccharinicus]